jgi:hypothetical protein
MKSVELDSLETSTLIRNPLKMDIVLAKVPRLQKGAQCLAWHTRIMEFLEDEGIQPYINGDISPPEEPSRYDYDLSDENAAAQFIKACQDCGTWRFKNLLARLAILKTVHRSLHPNIKGSTASAMVDILCRRFKNNLMEDTAHVAP